MTETLSVVELDEHRVESVVVVSVVDGQQTMVFLPVPFSVIYKKKGIDSVNGMSKPALISLRLSRRKSLTVASSLFRLLCSHWSLADSEPSLFLFILRKKLLLVLSYSQR